jgi:circadian clock protein KaiC
MNASSAAPHQLRKVSSGISGLDDVLHGGMPQGRTTLVCGAAGCGKTLFGLQFLVRGAVDYGEPGAFIAFEERTEDLNANVSSLGFDLPALEAQGLLSIDHVEFNPRDLIENGHYDLEGLFLRVGLAIDAVGAKRVVIDTLEVLFGSLSDYGVVRSELQRLFAWLKERGVTAIITAERGENALTRHGLEEYVSDCVILLDHRVAEQVSTRRLRVVKYRGSKHGTNEFPFLIDAAGIAVLPLSSAKLDHAVSDHFISTGVPKLDVMLGGSGYYEGSTVLISGTAGAGKSTLSAHFADGVCRSGKRCLYFSFEESPAQILRNMRSVGLDLGRHEHAGTLRFIAARPTALGLEGHLALCFSALREFEPDAVVFDPISNFADVGTSHDAHAMLVRLVDGLKARGTTALFTSLTEAGSALEGTATAISSIVDTWILVKTIESDGERNRGLYVLKSRGMPHSNQVREFVITSRGIDLVDVYVGEGRVLTGAARLAQEARDQLQRDARQGERRAQERLLERRRALHREQLARLEAEYESEVLELESRVRAALEADQASGLLNEQLERARGIGSGDALEAGGSS